MLVFIVIVLCLSFYLYAILGGADFGAGILELFTGNKSIKPIYKAIAPVWEANHMWLILAVVIIFNGFPPIYAEVSTSLHIPLFIVLIGIILRGTAFTFRHYDAYEDSTHQYYHFFFRFSSVLTTFFLGVILGALMLGWMTDAPDATFVERYISPWVNPFTVVMGVFSCALFAYIAAAYIIGETQTQEERHYFSRIAKRFGVATIILGAVVLLLAYIYNVPFIQHFIQSPISGATFILATLAIPFIWKSMDKGNIAATRIGVAAQVGFIMLGWAVIQLPTIVHFKSGAELTLYNSAAGSSTQFWLVVALAVGSCIIFPALYYLFRVFKSPAN